MTPADVKQLKELVGFVAKQVGTMVEALEVVEGVEKVQIREARVHFSHGWDAVRRAIEEGEVDEQDQAH